jgi:hypothetical protein
MIFKQTLGQVIFVLLNACFADVTSATVTWYAVHTLSRFEDGDRIQSPKLCVLNKNRSMDNVQKRNDERDEHRLKVFEYTLLRRIFGLKRSDRRSEKTA